MRKFTIFWVHDHRNPDKGFNVVEEWWKCKCKDHYFHRSTETQCRNCKVTTERGIYAKVSELFTHEAKYVVHGFELENLRYVVHRHEFHTHTTILDIMAEDPAPGHCWCQELHPSIKSRLQVPQHTEDCEKNIRNRDQANSNYREHYPNFCKTCNGYGGFSDPGNWDTPPDFTSCEECVEQGTCPRCGEKLNDKATIYAHGYVDKTCSHCNWTSENPEGLPEPGECFCWVNGDNS